MTVVIDLVVTRDESDETGKTAHAEVTVPQPVQVDWGDGSEWEDLPHDAGQKYAGDHAYSKEGFYKVVAYAGGLVDRAVFQTPTPVRGVDPTLTREQYEKRREQFATYSQMGDVLK